MGEKILVGPMTKGLRNDVTAFNVDNDSFPTLINAYQWRGRVKRKRGTAALGRLNRYTAVSTALTQNSGQSVNLISALSLQANASIVPGSISVIGSIDGTTYTDPNKDGTLTATGGTGTGGSINYTSGLITITAGGGETITGGFLYYPTLPVMGLEDLLLDPTAFVGCLAFDTTYSYNISDVSPYTINDVSFYSNPTASGSLPGYVPKGTWTPLVWNGQDYQQFWSTNYQNSFWAINGTNTPFSTTNIGMQYKAIVNVVINASGPPAKATISIFNHGLVIGDFLFLNEIVGNTGINFQTCYVIAIIDINNVQVEFPLAVLGGAYSSGGIAQYLTNNSDSTKDCIRYYTGSPTNATNPPTFNQGPGWVNFCPPLSNLSFSISNLPAAQYYLVGAKVVIPFKDRLLFIGPVVQTSAAGSQVYLQDTVIYSQNGTPYYTASFSGSPSSSTTYQQMLTPINQTAQPTAWWEDQTGLGGFIAAGFQTEINTVSANEDVLIMGFGDRQARFAYTGNDILPFQFFVINSELGSGATFSAINLDRGVMTIGSRGFIITSQIESRRFDLDIPDQVFEISLTSSGAKRICAQRDFINEWIYFTYSSNEFGYVYPTQTLQYNYRDQSWGIFNESYTTYGLFRKATGYTWATIGLVYPTWESWTTPWDSGTSTLLQPEVIAGNAQGFVIVRGIGTNEAPSGAIQSFSGSTVTSPNHCLNEGDYILIQGCLGTISSQVNGNIFSVGATTANTFVLDPTIGSGTYLGSGTFTRMYVPQIQTKQFPVSWQFAKKTRLGPQQYLLSRTANGQITLLIFLSQNASFPYNIGSIVPTAIPVPTNNSLIYSTILYTCPESTNLGLTPANINLQMVTGTDQDQIWHRMNTSLIGDTVQIGFTLSDSQMRDTTFSNQFVEIELHSFILDVNPSMTLA